VEAPKRAQAANCDRDPTGHSGHDPAVQQDPAPVYLADSDRPLRFLFSPPAPTEPQVTDVTAASAATILVRDDQAVGT